MFINFVTIRFYFLGRGASDVYKFRYNYILFFRKRCFRCL